MSPDYNPDKTAPDHVPIGGLIPQAKGGALMRGNPGNKGGGRTPERVRRLARKYLWPRMAALAAIADGETIDGIKERPTHGERIAAMKELGRIGVGGTTMPLADVQTRLVRQISVIREELDAATAERLIARLGREVWR